MFGKKLTRIAMMIFVTGASLAYNSWASAQTAQDYIASGRGSLAQRTITGWRDAYYTFSDGISNLGTADQELVFLHAVTRAAMLGLRDDCGNIDSLFELAAQYDIYILNNSFYPLDLDLQVPENSFGNYELPDDAPDANDIRAILDNATIPEIDAVLNDLALIQPAFTTSFDPSITGLLTNLEVDYGEVLMLRAFLKAIKAQMQTDSAYDVFIESDGLDTITEKIYGQCFDVNRDLLEPYPHFLGLLPTPGHPEVGTALLAQARQNLLDALNDYFNAMQFIRAETDDQLDDMLYIDPNCAIFIDTFDQKIAILRDSVESQQPGSYPWETTKTYVLGDSSHEVNNILELIYDATDVQGNKGHFKTPAYINMESWLVVDFDWVRSELLVFLEPNDPFTYGEGFLLCQTDGSNIITDATFEFWTNYDGYSNEIITGMTGYLNSSVAVDRQLNLTPVFDGSVELRDMLPQFGIDNRPQPATMGNRFEGSASLGGVLPGMTQDEWTEMFDFQPSGLIDLPRIDPAVIYDPCYVDPNFEPNWIIDGDLSHWYDIVPIFTDISGDAQAPKFFDANGLDIENLWLAVDDQQNLFVAVTCYDFPEWTYYYTDNQPYPVQGTSEGSLPTVYDLVLSYPGSYDSLIFSIILDFDENPEYWTGFGELFYNGYSYGYFNVALGANGFEFMVPKPQSPLTIPIAGRYIELNSSVNLFEYGFDEGGEDNDTGLKIASIADVSRLAQISGNVFYSDYPGGPIYVQAYSDYFDPNGSVVAAAMLSAPGPYTLEGIGFGWQGYVRAFAPWYGQLDNFNVPIVENALPVNVVDADITGVDLTLNGAPQLTLLNPVGGESVYAGQIYSVTWQSQGLIYDVVVKYSRNNGLTWNRVDPNNVGNSGTYNWLVPNVASDQCLIRVHDLADPRIADTSDAAFQIDTRPPTDLPVPDNYSTIQDAIDAAINGDTVLVRDGTYTGPGNRDLDFRGKAITVRSQNGPQNCTIDCQGSEYEPHRGFYFHSGESLDAIVEGFTIINGYGPSDNFEWPTSAGGAILCVESGPMITNCVIENCYAYIGGGIFCSDAGPSIYGSSFLYNTAQSGGGIACQGYGTVTLYDCFVFENNASGSGGGIFATYGPSVDISECTFSSNSAGGSGGGVYCGSAEFVDINYCDFSGNRASDGGGFYSSASYEPYSVAVISTTFNGNSADYEGGGMYNYGASIWVYLCDFDLNEAGSVEGGNGGGMVNYYADYTVFQNCNFRDNWAQTRGGGLYNAFSNATLMHCNFFNNDAADDSGGAVYNLSCYPSFQSCFFGGNEASWAGGAVCNSGASPAFTNCAFSGNATNDTSLGGGAIHNQTYNDGYTDRDSEPLITNCTFYANSANGSGGALYNRGTSGATLANCIFWANTAPNAPQIEHLSEGPLNLSYSDVEGGWTGAGNIDADPCFVLPHGSDGMVGTADDDLRLGGGSLAIDAGNSNLVPGGIFYDLAENPRFADDPFTADTGVSSELPVVDMGAYEYSPESDVFYVIYDQADSSMWFGGDDRPEISPRNVGVGQSVWFEQSCWLEKFSFRFTGPFDYAYIPQSVGHAVELVLQIRTENGQILSTYSTLVPESFMGGWVDFDVNQTLYGHRSYIFTCYLLNGATLQLNTGVHAWNSGNSDIYPEGSGFAGENTADTIDSWSDWAGHLWDFNFRMQGHWITTSHPLHVTIEGQGTVRLAFDEEVTVISPPSGTYWFDYGMAVNLTAQPAGGSRFVTWQGDAAGTNPNTQIIVDSEKNVTARFETDTPPPPPPPLTYTLSVNVIGNGSVAPTGGAYNSGAVVNLTATPAPGHRVKAWSGADNTPAAGNTNNTATMSGNRTVTVEFELIPVPKYTLSAAVLGGHGAITLAPPGGTYDQGAVVTLTVLVDPGWRVRSWQGADSNPPAGTITNTVTMTGNKTVTVECEPYVGSVSVTITPQAVVNDGARWLLDGAAHASGETVNNITVGSHTITFTNVLGWTTPQNIVVSVLPNQTVTRSATYIWAKPSEPEYGSLRVVLNSPQGSVDPDARWRIAGSSNWLTSGFTVTDMPPGQYTIEFNQVAGWTAPPSRPAEITTGDTTVATGTYLNQQAVEPELGSLTVNIEPAAAAALARWNVDGGAWQPGGQTVPDLSVGSHLLRFESIPGGEWLEPNDVTLDILSGYTQSATGTYIYIPKTAYVAPAGNDVTNLGTIDRPFRTIQRAINRVANGGTVIVLPGTYTGSGNRDLDFGLVSPAGARNLTVRSLNGPASTIIDSQGAESAMHRGFLFQHGETADSVLEGFTITGGLAHTGAGILCKNNSNPTIRNCVITENTCNYSGAGIRCDSSSPTLIDCTISDNTAQLTGGGIFAFLDSAPTLTGCKITDNTALGCGGGIYSCNESRPTFTNCLITGNSANSVGGGMYCATDSQPTLTNCTISANTANIGGAIRSYNSNPVITNSIIYQNTSRQFGYQLGNYQSAPVISYSDIQDSQGSGDSWNALMGTDAGGNIDMDPRFIDVVGGSYYHLATSSPCVDCADPALTCYEPQPNGARVNMGFFGNTQWATITVDTDLDGLSDPAEVRWGLNPNLADTDGDGLTDYEEIAMDGNPQTYVPYNPATGAGTDLNAALADTDGDGISDYDEVAYNNNAADYLPYNPATGAGTDLNALNRDTDGDGMTDAWEIDNDLNPLDPSDAFRDPDLDGANNLAEFAGRSDPQDDTSVPPAFNYHLRIARQRYGDGDPLTNGALALSVVPPAGGTFNQLRYVKSDGSDLTLPAQSPASYTQNDFFGAEQVALADIEEFFLAGLNTVELHFTNGSTPSVTFDHWVGFYPDFPAPGYPSDNQFAIPLNPTITWVGATAPTHLEIVDMSNQAAVLSTAIAAGAQSYTVLPGILQDNHNYLLALINDSDNATHLASSTLLRFSTYAQSTIIYVDDDAAGLNNGSSWENAYPALQDALAAATQNTEIWVAQGTYSPGVLPADSFQLVEGVPLYGGFDGTELYRQQRNHQDHPTILSGLVPGDQNVYHVVIGADHAVLDGFVITGGYAYGVEDSPEDGGAGVYCHGTSPTLANCTFRNNAARFGAGIYCDSGADPTILNCTFTENSAVLGAAILAADAHPVITNCLMAGNQAEDGVALYATNLDTPLHVTNCTITGNVARYFGGALLGWEASVVLTNSILWDNLAGDEGDQIAIGGYTHLTVANSDVQGGSDDIYRETGCTLTWDAGNLNKSPRFVDPGSWQANAWVPGDYHLRNVSRCIDAGNNEAVVGIDTDIQGNPRIYDNVAVDIGAYEYQGPGFIPSVTPITISSFSARPGAVRGYGTLMVAGQLGIDNPQDLDEIETLYIRVGPFERAIDLALDRVIHVGNLYLYINSSSSGTVLLNINLGTDRFSLTAQNVYLMGLAAPVPVEIAIGDYYQGQGQVDESMMTAGLPVQFLPEGTDYLRLDSATMLPGILLLRGVLAVSDTGIDLNSPDISVAMRWGDQLITSFPGENENFIHVGSMYLYLRNAALNPTGKVTLAIINLQQGTFSITVRDPALQPQTAGSVEFGLSFGEFNEVTNYEW